MNLHFVRSIRGLQNFLAIPIMKMNRDALYSPRSMTPINGKPDNLILFYDAGSMTDANSN